MQLEDNQYIADRLQEMAEVLELQGANPFRVNAFRRAARTVRDQDRALADIVRRDGIDGLEALPGIGRSIALAIREMLRTGRWSQLERIRGELDPVRAFQSVPGIGPELARRIHDTLDIESLEELELSAHDGRLEEVPGLGPRRVKMVESALAQMLQARSQRSQARGDEPPVYMLLDVDREYRQRAEAGDLRRIAPRRFNPAGEAWLPILHTQRGQWHFTALFSNTARAHDLGKTDDWVVIYFHTDDGPEAQRTVVTETSGGQAGKRVVRGREAEGAGG